ncbi:alpha/beta hydrolase [Phycicoccus jejuensis]|uniref:alpha/beta fold hydrolase n=1 Tax=Phycicoccus jejuensis TaxID=367299 RepID=UPI00384AB3CD
MHQVMSVGDVELSVHDTGGGGSAVVLLHGLAGHAEEWAGTRRAFEPSHRVVAFDQRGHGGSSRRPADVSRAAHVRDVVGVADRLGISRVTLVGQSMGGHTALLVAAQHPALVERLVLVESGVGGGGGAQLTADVAAMLDCWPVPFTDHPAAVRWFGGGPVGHAWADGLEARPGGLWPRFDVDVLVRGLSAVHEHQAWAEWDRVHQPTLLVSGTNGLIPSAEIDQMLHIHPAARHVRIRGAGHDVHLEAEDSWIRVLRTFVEEPAS